MASKPARAVKMTVSWVVFTNIGHDRPRDLGDLKSAPAEQLPPELKGPDAEHTLVVRRSLDQPAFLEDAQVPIGATCRNADLLGDLRHGHPVVSVGNDEKATEGSLNRVQLRSLNHRAGLDNSFS